MATMHMINGVDVERLMSNINAMNEDPGMATFRFRATNRWDNGGHNETVIQDFYGARQDIPHKHDFHIEADEPDLLLGEDQGANPVELVLAALAGCLTTSMVYHAAARGITIRAIESDLEGELDLRGFLGLTDTVRNGYKSLCVSFRIDADTDQATIDELVTLAKNRSPVFDIVSNPVEVLVKGEPMAAGTH